MSWKPAPSTLLYASYARGYKAGGVNIDATITLAQHLTTPVIASGKGRIIAVVGDRLPGWPDVPTMTEQGAVGGAYETRAFAAFAVPAATPKDIVRKLSDTLIEAGTDEKVKQLLVNFFLWRLWTFWFGKAARSDMAR